MIFHFIIPGEVSISMGNMINEFLAGAGVGDDARAELPAVNYLYSLYRRNRRYKEYLEFPAVIYRSNALHYRQIYVQETLLIACQRSVCWA